VSGLITRDGADYLLNLFVNGEQAVPTYYVALIVGAQPGVIVGGDELDEPVYDEYARGALANQSGNWKVDSGVLINMVEVDYPMPTVAWGDVRYWAICDQADAGRVLFVGSFSVPFTITVGDQPFIGAAALSIDLGLEDWTVTE
jgi:hypothetical protein